MALRPLRVRWHGATSACQADRGGFDPRHPLEVMPIVLIKDVIGGFGGMMKGSRSISFYEVELRPPSDEWSNTISRQNAALWPIYTRLAASTHRRHVTRWEIFDWIHADNWLE